MNRWRPMDTAPRDGSWILLRCPGLQEPAVFVAQWVTWDDPHDGPAGEWSEYHALNLEADPDAWAPLPEDAAHLAEHGTEQLAEAA